jgi:hypothetical protein
MATNGSLKAMAILKARRSAREALAPVIGNDAIEEALAATEAAIRAMTEDQPVESLKADLAAACVALKGEIVKAKDEAGEIVKDG